MNKRELQRAFCCLGLLALLFAARPALAETVISGGACAKLGISSVTSDRKNAVICLQNDRGILVWKPMTNPPASFAMMESEWGKAGQTGVTVYCPSGYGLIGGTCSWQKNEKSNGSALSSPNNNGWQCSSSDSERSTKAYAFCTQTP